MPPSQCSGPEGDGPSPGAAMGYGASDLLAGVAGGRWPRWPSPAAPVAGRGGAGIPALHRGLARDEMRVVAALSPVLAPAVSAAAGPVREGRPAPEQLAGTAIAIPAVAVALGRARDSGTRGASVP